MNSGDSCLLLTFSLSNFEGSETLGTRSDWNHSLILYHSLITTAVQESYIPEVLVLPIFIFFCFFPRTVWFPRKLHYFFFKKKKDDQFSTFSAYFVCFLFFSHENGSIIFLSCFVLLFFIGVYFSFCPQELCYLFRKRTGIFAFDDHFPPTDFRWNNQPEQIIENVLSEK